MYYNIMFRYIFENISNTIYSILYSNVDAKLNTIIKKHNNLANSYNILLQNIILIMIYIIIKILQNITI